jgi:hypothetical protein
MDGDGDREQYSFRVETCYWMSWSGQKVDGLEKDGEHQL